MKTVSVDPDEVKVGDAVWFYDPGVQSDGGFFPVEAIRRGGRLVIDLGHRKLVFAPNGKALVRALEDNKVESKE